LHGRLPRTSCCLRILEGGVVNVEGPVSDGEWFCESRPFYKEKPERASQSATHSAANSSKVGESSAAWEVDPRPGGYEGATVLVAVALAGVPARWARPPSGSPGGGDHEETPGAFCREEGPGYFVRQRGDSETPSG